MKKTIPLFRFSEIFFLFLLFGLMLSFSSCSDSDASDTTNNPQQAYVCTTCKTTPEALAENNNSFKGIYLGISTSDVVYFNIDNLSDGVIKALLMRDGVISSFSLTNKWSDETKNYFTFRGRITYGHHETPLINLDFSVDKDGKNPQFSFGSGIVSKAQSNFNIIKEKSDELIEVFDGQITQKIVRVIIEDNLQTNLTDSKVRSPKTEEVTLVLGSERYVISRSKGYWYSISSNLNINEEVLPSITNQGLIVNGILIDSNNQKVGKLVGHTFTGSTRIDEIGVVNLASKRVL